MNMTDMPSARRPSTVCRSRWLKASWRKTAQIEFDDFLVRNQAVRFYSPGGIFLVFAAQAKMTWAMALRKIWYSSVPPSLDCFQFGQALLSSPRRFVAQAICFGVVERAHVGFRNRGNRAQYALLAAPRAGPSPETSARNCPDHE